VTALISGAIAAPHAALAPRAAIGAFVLFCRIGGCLMLAPGFSSGQIPTQVRLFVALAVTLTLTPLLLERVPSVALGDDPILTLKVIAVESLVGGMIGVLARTFYFALEALAVGAAAMLGFASPFGFQIEGDETMAPLATLISLAAIALLFAANLHWELLRGLVASYDVVPVGADFYALVVNLALALVNRLTPQVQVFFVATPFVAAGGLMLLYFTIKPAIEAFISAFGVWLISG
jgi:flagellar biosynthesis protein FliR